MVDAAARRNGGGHINDHAHTAQAASADIKRNVALVGEHIQMKCSWFCPHKHLCAKVALLTGACVGFSAFPHRTFDAECECGLYVLDTGLCADCFIQADVLLCCVYKSVCVCTSLVSHNWISHLRPQFAANLFGQAEDSRTTVCMFVALYSRT